MSHPCRLSRAAVSAGPIFSRSGYGCGSDVLTFWRLGYGRGSAVLTFWRLGYGSGSDVLTFWKLGHGSGSDVPTFWKSGHGAIARKLGPVPSAQWHGRLLSMCMTVHSAVPS